MALDKKVYKNYISPIDQKIEQFDRSEPLSPSQQAEMEKYRHLDRLRDMPTLTEHDEALL
jgi:hypothetical protein